MYSFQEINDFVMRHTGSQYFESDLKLYKKHFPNSKLNAELDRAPDFAKNALDERMIYELLNNQDSCIDCIWENRGFVVDGSKLVPIKSKDEGKIVMPADVQAVFEVLIKTDISAAKHNDLKKFVFGLKLQDKCADQKKETYLKVLNDFIASLEPVEQDAIENIESHSDQVIDQMNQEKGEETPAPDSAEGEGKKKEDQSSNTQE